jgi:hypothetical protein
MIIIYVLEKNNIPFYIGKCNNINVRYSQHKKTYGEDVKINVLELVDDKEWKDKERFYISQYKKLGFELFNKNNGGGGPTVLSNESKQKITNSKLGKQYKLTNLLKGRIEEMYLTKSIYEISDILNISFPTIQKHLIEKNLYIPYKNKKVKDSTKIKMSYIMKDKFNKPVFQFDKNGNIIREHQSLTEACIFINKPNRQGDITSCCKGKQKTAFGYIWKYKKD